MGYRWVVGDQLTGKIHRPVDTIGSWTTRFDAADTMSGSFPLGALQLPSQKLEWETAAADTSEAKTFLAVGWVDDNNVPDWIAGGPLWTSDHDDSTNVLDFAGAGLETYFDHRFVLPLLTDKANLLSVTYSAADLALIVKRIVELAQSHPGGQLPIQFPTDLALGGPGDAHTHVFPGYELKRTADALRSLAKLDRGPEFQFVPRQGADERYLEWFLDIGVKPTGMLTQTGTPWQLDRTVKNGMVQKIRTSRNGGRLADRVFSAGQGQGQGRPIEPDEGTTLRDFGYPLLEAQTEATNVESQTDLLKSYAAGQRARSGTPAAAYTVVCDAATFWRECKGARAGDWADLTTEGHFSLPDGPNRVRILTMSGGGPSVELQVTPEREIA